jgi:chemotaxis protein MotC
MRTAQLAVISLLLAAAPAGRVAADESPRQPFELVRSLRSVQDEIARGSATAHTLQRTLIREIGERFLQSDPDAWLDPRNARAAVIYVLSGGDPAVLKELIARDRMRAMDAKLVKGVLAYGQGRSADAATLLLGIDARSLDSAVGGQLALVQSLLVAKSDPKRAMALLDDARLMSPGTLIEEAALRRETFLAAAAGQRERFEMLSSQYLRRFPNSIYSGSFRQQFASEVTSRATGSERMGLPALESTVKELPASDRRDIYLSIAKTGAIKGLIEVARFAAEQACKETCEAKANVSQARLYEGAVLIVTDQFESGLAGLKGLERADLPADDVELLDAALLIATEVRRPVSATDASSPPPSQQNQRSRGDLPSRLMVADLAQKAIARVDKLLREAK